jgi:hypothetical protein
LNACFFYMGLVFLVSYPYLLLCWI